MQLHTYDKAIEVAKGIYWVGYNIKTVFRSNPYLIVDDEEAMLIDPGSSYDFFPVQKKIITINPLSRIEHIILHHQDPDLCGSTSQFEAVIGHDIKIYNPLRASFLQNFII